MQAKPFKIVLVITLLLVQGISMAQKPDEDKGTIEILGQLSSMSDQGKLEGVVITVYKGSQKVDEFKSDKKGNFRVVLYPNTGEYAIRFSYPLHVSMYCMVNTSIPEKSLPFWGGHKFVNLPLWPTNTKEINIYAFKDYPFAKIRWEKKSFGEDLAHFEFFKKKVEDIEELASIRQKEIEEANKKEKERKEKEEKERLEKERKEKELTDKELALKELLEKEKKEREQLELEQKEKALKQKKLLEEQKRLEEELAKKKEENVSDEVKMKQEKEIKEKIKEKNQAITSQYRSELLIMVAENEKKMKEESMLKKKMESDANAIAEKLRREEELKTKIELLEKEIAGLKAKNQQNSLNRIVEINGIIKTTAEVEKSIREEKVKTIPDVKSYSSPTVPIITTTLSQGVFSYTTYIEIVAGKEKVLLSKEYYVWGTEQFYKDGKEISRLDFIREILKYKNMK
jgi:hypothetical protein